MPYGIAQDVDLASEYIRRYGAKFTVIATEVNGPSYERLTLHNIRNYTQPGDRILCAAVFPGVPMRRRKSLSGAHPAYQKRQDVSHCRACRRV